MEQTVQKKFMPEGVVIDIGDFGDKQLRENW